MNRINKVAFNIFTYSKDFPCLKESIKSIRRLKGCKTSQIFIWDDGNFPLSDTEVAELKKYKIHYEKTYFNRNKNLNGIDCVIGMLICMELCHRMSGARYIFKVDSDSYLNSIDFYIKGLKDGYKMVGTELKYTAGYCAGCCYALDSDILYNMVALHNLLIKEKTERLINAPHYPEDLAITELVRLLGGKVLMNKSNSSVSPQFWELAPFQFTEYKVASDSVSFNCLSRYRFYSVCNFGNRYEIAEIKDLKDKDPHKIAGRCMQIYSDYIGKINGENEF